MIRYKRIISTKSYKVIIENHYISLYLGVDDSPAKVIDDRAYADPRYLWDLILEKIGDEEVVDDYTIITTSSMEYKISAWLWGSSILYRQLNSKHYKTYNNYIVYSAVSINGWFGYFKAD